MYIGNTVTTQGFTPAIDYFSGNGSTTVFTLSRPVASVAQVQCVIENVPQNPGTAFTVNGNTITFTSAPPSGTNNIYVYYTSPITQVVALPQSPQVFGNLQMSSAGGLFTGDFTNATLLNRNAFQTSTVNGSTGIYALPNGTSTAASWQATNAADPTNASKILIATNGSTDVQLVSGRNGTGTYLPLTFYTNGSEQMRIDTSGNVGIGTASPVSKLNVKTVDGSGIAMLAGTTIGARYTSDASGIYIDGTDPTGLSSYQPFYTGGSIWGVRISGAEKMRVDSSGNLLVGTTSATTGKGLVNLASNKTYQVGGTSVSALAWVNFNGTTSPGTIRSQYNVSSVTKNGTGDYTLNFTSALTDANYSAVGSSQRFTQLGYNTQTTTQLQVLTQNLAGSQSDVTVITVAVFGN